MQRRLILISVIALTALLVAIPVGIHFYKTIDFHARKATTLERIAVSMNEDLILAIRQSTQSTLQRPRIWKPKMLANYYADGWVIDVGWIAERPMANGLQINFADGTSVKVGFSEPVLADLEKRESSIYYFNASVDENDSSVLSRELSPSDVKSACLLAGDRPVSVDFTVDISDAKPIWKKDEKNSPDSAEEVGAGPTEASGT
jgi:hypothetical protein